jgi:transaldolase
VMTAALAIMSSQPQVELIWASPRELLNVFQAESIGCHVITATPDILKKLSLIGKNLADYSLETVAMFFMDATRAGFTLFRTKSVAAD